MKINRNILPCLFIKYPNTIILFRDLVTWMSNVLPRSSGPLDLFLNRSVPLFLKGETILKLKDQKLIKIEAPFLDEISGLATIKLLDRSTQSTIM